MDQQQFYPSREHCGHHHVSFTTSGMDLFKALNCTAEITAIKAKKRNKDGNTLSKTSKIDIKSIVFTQHEVLVNLSYF